MHWEQTPLLLSILYRFSQGDFLLQPRRLRSDLDSWNLALVASPWRAWMHELYHGWTSDAFAWEFWSFWWQLLAFTDYSSFFRLIGGLIVPVVSIQMRDFGGTMIPLIVSTLAIRWSRCSIVLRPILFRLSPINFLKRIPNKLVWSLERIRSSRCRETSCSAVGLPDSLLPAIAPNSHEFIFGGRNAMCAWIAALGDRTLW